MSIIAWFVVGAIAGWLAGLLVKGDEGLGVIGHIVLGIVGALVGGFLFGLLTNQDYTTGINIGTIVVATIGAVLVVVVVGMIRGGRTGRVVNGACRFVRASHLALIPSPSGAAQGTMVRGASGADVSEVLLDSGR